MSWINTCTLFGAGLPKALTKVYVTAPTTTLLPAAILVKVMDALRLIISGAVAVSIGCRWLRSIPVRM
ncbi:MAG: hypothetical protein ACOX3R_16490 [Desulfitobacteriia bacterium]